VVVELGEEAEATGLFKVGDRVMAVNTARGCRECLLTKYGRELTRQVHVHCVCTMMRGESLRLVVVPSQRRVMIYKATKPSLTSFADPSRFCPKSAEIGLRGVDGAFADYGLVDAKYTVKIPDEMTFEQAAPMSCAGVTSYHSITRCNLRPGQVGCQSGRS
jgi:D-arabinose 1-dehydrogenase-like Zn-dependent alcohol dehydrogenase